jgi:hypothetical protein
VALRLPVAALSALLLSACEVYAVPDPIVCPDVRQGTFDFVGDRIVLENDCFFAQPGNPANQVNNPIAFNGTISFIPGGNEAALCIGAPHAASNLGTYTAPPPGDVPYSIDVFFRTVINLGGCTCPSAAAVTAGNCLCPPNSPLSNCSCPALLEQHTEGELEPILGGFSGFTGVQKNTVTPPPGPVPPDICDCQKTCSYSYNLAAKAVGTR